MVSQLKATATEAAMEKASGTMEIPVKAGDDGGGTKKALLNNENTSMVDRLKEIETASKTTEGPPQKEFADELSRLQDTKAHRNQSPEAIDKLKSDGQEVFSEIRVGKDNQLHIQKLPQGQDVKIQQNIEKIEASMVKMIQSVKEGDTSKMTVTLEPEALGKVNLDLKMENGRMTARIFVENNQVREMFDGKLGELTTNLQKHNINVEKIQLHVNQGTESQQLDMGQQGSFSRHQGRQGWQSNQNYLFKRIEESLAGSHREKAQEGLSILA
jgi:flagellar hook-length control protein FliK